jgi:hypothetical protein
MWNAEAFQNACGVLHYLPVTVAAHYDADYRMIHIKPLTTFTNNGNTSKYAWAW